MTCITIKRQKQTAGGLVALATAVHTWHLVINTCLMNTLIKATDVSQEPTLQGLLCVDECQVWAPKLLLSFTPRLHSTDLLWLTWACAVFSTRNLPSRWSGVHTYLPDWTLQQKHPPPPFPEGNPLSSHSTAQALLSSDNSYWMKEKKKKKIKVRALVK